MQQGSNCSSYGVPGNELGGGEGKLLACSILKCSSALQQQCNVAPALLQSGAQEPAPSPGGLEMCKISHTRALRSVLQIKELRPVQRSAPGLSLPNPFSYRLKKEPDVEINFQDPKTQGRLALLEVPASLGADQRAA